MLLRNCPFFEGFENLLRKFFFGIFCLLIHNENSSRKFTLPQLLFCYTTNIVNISCEVSRFHSQSAHFQRNSDRILPWQVFYQSIYLTLEWCIFLAKVPRFGLVVRVRGARAGVRGFEFRSLRIFRLFKYNHIDWIVNQWTGPDCFPFTFFGAGRLLEE